MDWKEVGKKIIKLGAPLLGTALLGPAGTSIGAIVASAFGSDTGEPEEVLQKIIAHPEVTIKLRELELKYQVELQKINLENAKLDVERELGLVQEVNATMRDESKSEKWWVSGWRPYWGFSSGTAFIVVCGYVCWLTGQAISGKNPNAMTMIPMVIGSFTALFGIPGAILGITAWGRNKLKLKEKPNLMALNQPKPPGNTLPIM